MTHYDVIIIGTGAGGGTLAYHLAPSGKRILLLERGDYVRREKDNWSSRAVNVDAKYHTKEVWQDKDGRPLHPHTNYYVGGDSKGNTYLLQRLGAKNLGGLAKDRINMSITLPAYVKDVARVQIYCAWAEAVLGEAPFGAPLLTMNK